MFDNLSERLERSFKILKGEGKITEINVAETLKDVRKALLDADVNYKVAKSFTDTINWLGFTAVSTFTAPPLSNSCAYWQSRSKCPCIPNLIAKTQ